MDLFVRLWRALLSIFLRSERAVPARQRMGTPLGVRPLEDRRVLNADVSSAIAGTLVLDNFNDSGLGNEAVSVSQGSFNFGSGAVDAFTFNLQQGVWNDTTIGGLDVGNAVIDSGDASLLHVRAAAYSSIEITDTNDVGSSNLIFSNGSNINLGGVDLNAQVDQFWIGSAWSGSGDLTVDADGIIVGSDITTTAGGSGGDLALSATTIEVMDFVSIDTSAASTGDVQLTGRTVSLRFGSQIVTDGGDITLTADVGGASQFVGINVDGAVIQATGTGDVTLLGTGGTSISNNNFGVRISGAGALVQVNDGNLSITGQGGGQGVSGFNAGVAIGVTGASAVRSVGSGSVTITGTGGLGSAGGQDGVFVSGAGTTIATVNGDLTINGFGGGQAGVGGDFNIGIDLAAGLTIASTGAGNVLLTGTGGLGTGQQHDGIQIWQPSLTAPTISATSSGRITLTGVAQNAVAANSVGIRHLAGTVTTAGGTGRIEYVADSMILDDADANLTQITAGGNQVTLQQFTAGRAINLGGPDSATQLGLTDAEIDRVTAGTLVIGDANAGDILVTQVITPAGTNHLSLHTNGGIFDGHPSTELVVANLTLTAARIGNGLGNELDTNTTGLLALTTTGSGASGDIALFSETSLSTNSSRLTVATAASAQTVILNTLGTFNVDGNFGNSTDSLHFTARGNAGGISFIQTSGRLTGNNLALIASGLTSGSIGSSSNLVDTQSIGLFSLTTTGVNSVGDIHVASASSLGTSPFRLAVSTDASTQTIQLTTAGTFTINSTFGSAADDLIITALNSGAGVGILQVPGTVLIGRNIDLRTSGGAAGDIGGSGAAISVQTNGGGTLGLQALGSDIFITSATDLVVDEIVTVAGQSDTVSITTTAGATLTLTGAVAYSGLDGANGDNVHLNADGTLTIQTTPLSVRTLEIDTTGDQVNLDASITANQGIEIDTLGGSLADAGTPTFSVGTLLDIDLGGGNGQIDGVITGAGGLTKAGGGTLRLTGENSFAGVTNVNNGTLTAAHATALGTTGGNTIVAAAGTLRIDNVAVGAEAVALSGALEGVGTASLNGVVSLTGTAALHTDSLADGLTLTGAIDGTGGFLKTGAGTLTLSNASNSFAGAINIQAGTLRLGNSNVLPNTAIVHVANGATLDLRGRSDTIDGLAGAGTVTSSTAGTITLTVGASGGTNTFGGAVQDGAATVALTKTGTGTQTLSGTNTYTGATSVNQGTLLIEPTGSITSNVAVSNATVVVNGTVTGSVIVGSGGVLRGTQSSPGGPGLVTGIVTVNNGGTLSPGNSPGILNTGNLTLASGSTYTFEVDDDTAGSGYAGGVAGLDYDQTSVTGTVTIGATAVLNLVDLGSTAADINDVYTLILNDDSADAVTGTFGSITGGTDLNGGVLANGDDILFNGDTWRIFYNGGDGNDVVLIHRATISPAVDVFVSNASSMMAGFDFTIYHYGDLIADVDFLDPGVTPGIYGVDAFGTVAEAVAFVDAGAVVNVNAGDYHHTGTLLVRESITIDGQGSAGPTATRILKAGAPSGTFDEAVRVEADNVTIQDVQLGWQNPAPAVGNPGYGSGYVLVLEDQTNNTMVVGTTISNVRFDGENYRSAIVLEGTDSTVIADSVFDGNWARAAIRDGTGLTRPTDAAAYGPLGAPNTNFFITRNEFREDHYRWGPISLGPQDGETYNNSFSGVVSFNYFANGLDTDFQSEGNRNFTVSVLSDGVTTITDTVNLDEYDGLKGLVVDHNTFDWNDSNATNSNGVYAQPIGVYVGPAVTTNTDEILIQDNIFNNYAYAGPQPGAASPDWRADGRVIGNGALHFDGVGDFGVLQFPNQPQYDLGDSGSLTVWVQTDVGAKRHMIAGGALEMQIDDSNRVYFYPGNLGSSGTLVRTTSPSTIAPTAWTHLSFTWNNAGPASTQEGRIYIDGQPVSYGSGLDPNVAPNWTTFVDVINQLTYIGRDPDNPGARDFQGSMDDLAFYNTALSAGDVLNIYNNGAATVAHASMVALWEFTTDPGLDPDDIAYDSLNGLPLYLVTDGISPFGPTWVAGAGVFGGALDFDGQDDLATFRDPAFNVGAAGTLNFWVKVDPVTTSTQYQFFEGPDNSGLEMQFQGNSGGRFFGRTTTVGGDVVRRNNGDTTLVTSAGANNFWHNVQYTWDFATGQMWIYVDGTGVNVTDYASGLRPNDLVWASAVDTVNGLMHMGYDPGSAGQHYSGLIDDVAWFDETLTGTELATIRDTSVGMTGVAELAGDSRLLAHWNFDAAPTLDNTYLGDSGTSIVLYLQQLPATVPVSGYGVFTPANAMVMNNVFFNDVVGTYADSNQTLDASNITGPAANPFFDGDQQGLDVTTVTLEEYYTIRFGSSAAFTSTEFVGPPTNPATLVPHIGAYQGPPVFSGIEDVVIAGSDFDDLLVVEFFTENSGQFTLTRDIGGTNVIYADIAFADINTLTFNGFHGDDVMIVIQPDNDLIGVPGDGFTAGIFFNGGLESGNGNLVFNDPTLMTGDNLILLSSAADSVSIDRITYSLTDYVSDLVNFPNVTGYGGTITLTDSLISTVSTSTIIAFTGLDNTTGHNAVLDELIADERVFHFNTTAATETITLESSGDPLSIADPTVMGMPLGTNAPTRTSPSPLQNRIGSTESAHVSFSNPLTLLDIHAGSGDQTINIDSVDSAFRAEVNIAGESGFDTVNLNGNLTLGSAAQDNTGNLTVTAESINVAAGVAIDTAAATNNPLTGGVGNVLLDASRNIVMNTGSSITTLDGTVTLLANQGALASTGDFDGILLDGASITTGGPLNFGGDITLRGRGGDSDNNRGVVLESGAVVSSLGLDGVVEDAGKIIVEGVGGSAVNGNVGVEIDGVGSGIVSIEGDILVQGTGTGTGTDNAGVHVNSFGRVESRGSADIIIVGDGGADGFAPNAGILLENGALVGDDDAAIGDANGDGSGQVIFDAGADEFRMETGAVVRTNALAGETARIVVAADQIELLATGVNDPLIHAIRQGSGATAGVAEVVLAPDHGNTVDINLGVNANVAGDFALDEVELNAIAAPVVVIGLTDVVRSGTLETRVNQFGDSFIGPAGPMANECEIAARPFASETRSTVTVVADGFTADGDFATDLFQIQTRNSSTAGSVVGDIDDVVINGSIDLATSNPGRNFEVFAGSDITQAAAAKVTTGDDGLTDDKLNSATETAGVRDGDIFFSAERSITITGNATAGDIVSTNGEITLLANDATQVVGGGVNPTTGDTFTGIALNNADVTTGVAGPMGKVGGDMLIRGTGGNLGTGNMGVLATGGTAIASRGSGSDAGTITVVGNGGAGTGGDVGVRFSASSVASVDGDIAITGVGGGTGNGNRGVQFFTGTSVTSTGTGTDAATITIHGTGAAGGQDNEGVAMNAATVSSQVGDISITGIGRGTATGNTGVHLQGATTVASLGTGTDVADITITGTAQGGGNDAVGVEIDAATVQTEDGDISITGVSQSTGASGLDGVVLRNGTLIDANHDGEIAITGTAAASGVRDAVQIIDSIVRTNTTQITVTGVNDDVRMTGTAAIESNSGNALIQAANDIYLTTVNLNLDAAGAQGTAIITADADTNPAFPSGQNSDCVGRVIDNLAGEAANVIAAAAVFRAGTGIGNFNYGTPGDEVNDMDVEVMTLAAFTCTGDIFISDESGVTIDNLDGLTNGLEIQTGTGDILVRADDDMTVIGDVVNAAEGSVTLGAGVDAAGGAISITANISTDSGGVRLVAFDGLAVNGSSLIDVSAGDAQLHAGRTFHFDETLSAGAVDVDLTLATDTQVVTDGGDVMLTATDDVLLSRVTAPDATVYVIADSDNSGTGSITDNHTDDGSGHVNITAANAALRAASGIGATDAIDTDVTTLAAVNGQNAVQVDDVSALVIDTVAGRAFSLELTDLSFGETGTGEVADLSDVRTTTSGDIKVRAAGSLTVNDGTNSDGVGVAAAANGNVLLQAVGANSDVVLNADVTSGTGHITLLAGDDIDQNANVDVATIGGTVYLNAANSTADAINGIDMAATAVISTSGCNARLVATGGGDVRLGRVNAAAGNVSILADGSVLDNNGATVNVEATGLRMLADADNSGAGSIGAADAGNGTPAVNANAIDTAVTTLAARSATGIYIDEADAITIGSTGVIGVTQVNFQAAGSAVVDASLSDLTTTNNGAIKIISRAGSITINEGDADDTGVSAHGTGDILLEARGSASDIVLNADVESATGDVTVNAGDDIDQNADIATIATGTVYLLAGNATTNIGAAQAIDMADGVSITSGGGDVLLRALNDGHIGLARVNAGAGTVFVEAQGSIVDNNDGVTPGSTNIQAASVGLVADSDNDGSESVGTATNAIETTVATLAARATGSVHLEESDDLAIGTVSVTVQRANFNSTQTPVLASLTGIAAGDDLELCVDGSLSITQAVDVAGTVRLHAVGGDVTQTADGIITATNLGVSAAGDIHLSAANNDVDVLAVQGQDITFLDVDDVTIGAVIASACFPGVVGVVATEFTICAGGDLTITELVDVDQTVRIDAAGDVTQSAAIQATALGIHVTAGGNIALTNAANDVDFLAAATDGGSITFNDVDDLTIDHVAAYDCFMTAVTGVSVPSNSITITTGGDLVIDDATGTPGAVGRINADVNGTNDAASIVTLTSGGALIDGSRNLSSDGELDVIGHTVTLSAQTGIGNGSGVLGDTFDLDLNATVLTVSNAVSGHVQLFEADDVRVNTITNLTRLAVLDTAGQISDHTPVAGDTTANITAQSLAIRSGAGIGSPATASGNDLDLAITNLSASTADGDLFLSNSLDLNITTVGGQAGVTNSGASDVISITVDGDINVLRSVSNAGVGSTTLDAREDITVDAPISSVGGAINLLADQNVTLNVLGDVSSQGGAVTVRADQDGTGGAGAGAILMTDNGTDSAIIDAGSGTVLMSATNDITLGGVTTTNGTSSAVAITTTEGAIIDGGDVSIEITAENPAGLVTLSALNCIGVGNPLETSLAHLAAAVLGTGGIEINEVSSTGLELQLVTTANGSVTVTSVGTITATRIDTSATQNNTNDVSLTTTGAAADILVTAIHAGPVNDVILTSADDVLNTAGALANSVIADDLIILATNNAADGAAAVQLRTRVQDLTTNVLGGHQGNIEIVEVDDLNLATADTLADARTVSTSNGVIDITTGGDLTVVDAAGGNDDASRTSDVEIIGGGALGGVSFTVGGDLKLQTNAQIDAYNAGLTPPPAAGSTVTQGSTVVANAPIVTATVQGDIQLGELSQVRTLQAGSGAVVGVSRQIAGRPDMGPPATDGTTAFYDASSVAAPTLTRVGQFFQASLTVTIGQPGETGLTILIDWGTDASDRFETVTGLVGGQTYTFVHDYAEFELLDSRIRRASSADPLSVQFGVSMEGSVRFLGNTVTTADGLTTIQPDVDASGVDHGLDVLTSTDLISTVVPDSTFTDGQFVENGLAFFILPAGVGSGIPNFLTEVRLPVTERQLASSSTGDQATASIVTTDRDQQMVLQVLGREEYLELRVVSPDPDAAPLAVRRLPDEFLAGKEGASFVDLFDGLPDGTYEIWYVLGSNRRMLVRVEVRDGKPEVQQDELDGGRMKLEEVIDRLRDELAPSDAVTHRTEPATQLKDAELPVVSTQPLAALADDLLQEVLPGLEPMLSEATTSDETVAVVTTAAGTTAGPRDNPEATAGDEEVAEDVVGGQQGAAIIAPMAALVLAGSRRLKRGATANPFSRARRAARRVASTEDAANASR